MRTRFAMVTAGEMVAPRSKRQLRNRAKVNLERPGSTPTDVKH
jgi:hypothetical protein